LAKLALFSAGVNIGHGRRLVWLHDIPCSGRPKRLLWASASGAFRRYANSIRDELPEAITVLDAFHVVKLGSATVDEVRRRVQQDTLGHRDARAIRSTASAGSCR
jgi:hypothetical protein